MRIAFALLALGPLLAAASQTAAPPRPPAAAPLSADECAVFARELSFARTVADHDAVAFGAHVAPDAAFGAGTTHVQRGRAAILRAWAPIIRGEAIRLEWYPTRTTAVGNLAWSTGPALIEELGGTTPHYEIGGFQTVWRRGADGVWQVLFDGGTPPKEADGKAAEAFRAARPTGCPVS